MNSDPQTSSDFARIARAIEYARKNFREQPSLGRMAAAANLSPSHFQRLFAQWAGVSPKKFLQFLSVEYAKALLDERRSTLLDTAHQTGLSGTGRLHDLFVTIEQMTPGEYREGGAGLRLNYSFTPTPFGRVLVATTARGVCHLAFADDPAVALGELRERFPHAEWAEADDAWQQSALKIFSADWTDLGKVRLHLRASPFQLKVWQALLQIPLGQACTYGDVAAAIDRPGASRAVGTAVGRNPVAYLIPCHRVIRSCGDCGGYRWGPTRKSAMLGWEAAQR